MFVQEMKFDMALKGTASWVTPSSPESIQTPPERIKNASSLISSAIFFSLEKFFFWFIFLELTRFPFHPSVLTVKHYYH